MAATVRRYELKIFVDKEKGTVLFAEAEGEFVDVLFGMVAQPLNTIVSFIGKTRSEPAEVVGCFGRLYQSAERLGNEQFCALKMKDRLLEPRLYLNSLFSNALKFIITDNLQVAPVVPGTIVGYLNNVGTIDPSMIEDWTVKLDLNEMFQLLGRALLSKTPLTDIFGVKTNPPLGSVPEKVFLHKKPSGESRKLNVKVVLKKSSQEFLFVEAGGDFIDFLFSLLLIPLGTMLHILEGQSGLGCIDVLYKSAQCLDSQHFFSQALKNSVLIAKFPPHFIWENHLLPLDSTPMGHTVPNAGGFVRKEAVFIVLDNLTVKPSSAAEAISVMNTHKTSFSDLEERTVSLGMAEGISILRASLNSTSAISNGLLRNNIVLVKEPKQEK